MRYFISSLLFLLPSLLMGQADKHGRTYSDVPKSKFWGNAWQISSAYNLCRSAELDLCLGRALCKEYPTGGVGMLTMRSWGFSYGLAPLVKPEKEQVIKAFYEASGQLTVLFFGLGYRAEYMYNLNDRSHYLRPAIGYSPPTYRPMQLDIFYNYAIKLSGERNDYRHGISFRLKYYFIKKWMVVHDPC